MFVRLLRPEWHRHRRITMFNNLIESASHTVEMKRRGSFFLFALGGYALLFAASGVASVLAYDAHLEKQNLELVSLVAPVEEITDLPHPATLPRSSAANNSDQPHPAMRTSTPPSNDP